MLTFTSTRLSSLRRTKVRLDPLSAVFRCPGLPCFPSYSDPLMSEALVYNIKPGKTMVRRPLLSSPLDEHRSHSSFFRLSGRKRRSQVISSHSTIGFSDPRGALFLHERERSRFSHCSAGIDDGELVSFLPESRLRYSPFSSLPSLQIINGKRVPHEKPQMLKSGYRISQSLLASSTRL